MSDPSSASSPGQPSSRQPLPLDGEVLPPTLRVLNPPPPRESATTAARPSFRLKLGTMALTAGLAVLFGGSATLGMHMWRQHAMVAASQPSPTTLALSRLGKDMAELRTSVETARQDETVRALKKSVDQLRAELDGLRSTNTAAIAQLSAKLDKPVAAATAPGLADVTARLEKLDRDPRMADITARLDRIERQVSSPTPTGSIAPATHASAAAQTVVAQAAQGAQANAAPRAGLRTAVLDNWIVRDVYSGIALVEGRSGSVREVVPGETLPGAGEVRSIERHGRGWVVVTSRGIIDTETW